MSWGYDYEDARDEREREDRYAFPVTCLDCGAEYDNRDDSCPSCQSNSVSYRSADAARWNRNVERRH